MSFKADEKLANLLICPACKSKVSCEADAITCMNSNCGLIYPVREGIPVMLIEEAKRPSKG